MSAMSCESELSALTAYSCCLYVQCILEFVVCIVAFACAVSCEYGTPVHRMYVLHVMCSQSAE